MTAAQPDIFLADEQRPRCILMDPPWPETGGGNRGADAHYEVHNLAEIEAIIRGSGVFTPHPEGSHLWMWSTVSSDELAHELMRRLGYRYVTQSVWVKLDELAELLGTLDPFALAAALAEISEAALEQDLQRGLGQYQRVCHELLLLGVRGRVPVPPPARRPPSVIFARRGEHSAKPDLAFRWPEAISPGPRLEMFARAARPGWNAWGNEAPAGGIRP